MQNLVDLYIKLLIGTFSFIGPSFSLLIPLFFPAIRRATQRHQEKLRTSQRVIQETLIKSNASAFAKGLQKSNDDLKKLEKNNRKELNLLNPKRQIRRLFVSLFSAIVLIGVHQFGAHHYNELKSFNTLIDWWFLLVLFLSVLAFCYALYVLWQIFCVILTAKTDDIKEEEEKRSEEDTSKGGVLTAENINN